MSGYSIAVDIGGTFTDIVLRRRDGSAWVDKTLTTHADLLDGFFLAVRSALAQAGITAAEVDDVIVHATTLVTNCVIERKGAKAALLVTKGFRDILIIRDEGRTNIFDNQLEFVEPLIPRERTFGIAERTLADGTVETEVDQAELRACAKALAAAGIKSVAVCFLNAYVNPQNERIAGAVLRDEAPDLHISLSSDVAPLIREYPRATTAAINAYTIPIVRPYLDGLIAQLARHGFRQHPLIMLSSGGVIGADTASRFPVRMIELGPAAGALAAAYFSAALKVPNLLGFDMGGTTAKACFIENGEPLITNDFEVAQRYRFQRGSGLPVLITCIDMIEIGAGGGSIARLDALGMLSVGPESAGSDPGPVCYGRGGTAPTVTDADLVLGMLDADNFLGGEMKLDRAATEGAIAKLGRALGSGPEETALGIFKMVSESMAGAVRSHAADRGADWHGLSILAFGGAGPVHACYVGELLEAEQVIYPPLASVLSAFGTLVTPLSIDLARGAVQRLGQLKWDAVHALCAELTKEGRRALVDAGCRAEEIRFTISADMRYHGQEHDMNVEIGAADFAARNTASVRRLFEEAYERRYRVRLPDVEVEIVTWRVRAHGPGQPRRTLKEMRRGTGGVEKRRRVVFPTGAFDVPVLPRAALEMHRAYRGPLVIEERETTIVIHPGWTVAGDASGCLTARPGATLGDDGALQRQPAVMTGSNL